MASPWLNVCRTNKWTNEKHKSQQPVFAGTHSAPGATASAFRAPTQGTSQPPYTAGTASIPVSQMRKLRPTVLLSLTVVTELVNGRKADFASQVLQDQRKGERNVGFLQQRPRKCQMLGLQPLPGNCQEAMPPSQLERPADCISILISIKS